MGSAVSVPDVEVVVAHSERATLRVGDVYLKVDADGERAGTEVAAMALAPVPTARVLWWTPPVLALAAVPGRPLGRLGEPSSSSPAAWAAAGALLRSLHEAPVPPWSGRAPEKVAADLDAACRWLLDRDVVPAELVTRNRRIAEAALRPWTLVFAHGDLQVAHVLVEGDAVTGVLDWSEAGPGDPLHDLAILTFGHAEHLRHVLDGYGGTVDLAVVRAWWSLRSLVAIPWLLEHGFDPFRAGCEVDVLRAAR